ncbi:DMT family transporter [Gilvimarinus algae]|uniref:DMT family transporter n=1 Tax=Gilvimarinus algae TaxID=3058037 RepID=A0ABT8TDZ6_9GAMM|nr:DMT family transporter [Gilvimarinus sp. SDUM040014]MDO3382342.1 DMT family transporter [Gilvimarinus sp. SDUM040014]
MIPVRLEAWLAASLAMLAFAGNSVLCRLALAGGAQAEASIDALSFTLLRLCGGALVLTLIMIWSRHRALPKLKGNWCGAFWLAVYAFSFSLAYLRLQTATGALILFGCVQCVLLAASWLSGVRPGRYEYVGLVLAFLGFSILLVPQASRPDLLGALLMGVSGFAWAMYTLVGRHSTAPLLDTCGHFIRASVLALPLLGFIVWWGRVSFEGVVLALVSGGLTSALGYALWYRALAHFTRSQAGVIQLSVPLIAALGGVVFLREPFTVSLLLAIAGVLSGVYLTSHNFEGKSGDISATR